MNWELYQNAYKKASPELRELLDSERIPSCVKTQLEKRNLSLLKRVSVVEISAYVVGIQTIDETVKKLIEAGVPDALQLLAEVQTCINGHNTNSKQSQATPSPTESLQSEINAAEHDLESIKGIRTMAHDMEEVKTHPVVTPPAPEPVHQSSQADLLRQIETMASPNNTPRWDTEK